MKHSKLSTYYNKLIFILQITKYLIKFKCSIALCLDSLIIVSCFRSLIKKKKIRWNQRLSKCLFIVVLFVILKLALIYILYILFRNGAESKETPKVPLVKFNISLSPIIIYYTYKEKKYYFTKQ